MTKTHLAMTEPGAARSFMRYVQHGPSAFAVTRGDKHELEFANIAFRRLTGANDASLGHPLTESVEGPQASGLRALLDRVYRTGAAARDECISDLGAGTPKWHCTVWPQLDAKGRPDHLVIELWEASQADLMLALQREVAERMLLSALRERDATEKAELSARRATFLAAEGRRLAESLDEVVTHEAVARLALPSLAAWCIVDIFDGRDEMCRLRIVHPDSAKQIFLRGLEDSWKPEPSDPFGLPAAVRLPKPTLIEADDVDAALASGAHNAETLRFLRAVGIGSLLTVPLIVRETLIGAVTFVSERHDRGFTPEDIALAEELAAWSAIALDSAKLHGEALTLKTFAETASKAKSTFLGTMSHELRTPLNAIGGYVDLLLMGVRGPVSPTQAIDLERIKSNQRHLLGLITDLLNFVRVDSKRISYNIVDVIVHDAVVSAVTLIESLILNRGLTCDLRESDCAIVLRADADKLQQILLNLLSNAVKFTPSGGRISVDCEVREGMVHIHILDNGIGIPADKLEAIFDPFVQVKEGFAGRDTGIGLGLAISRDLARAMGGDLRVTSDLGHGSRFTLVLPRAS